MMPAIHQTATSSRREPEFARVNGVRLAYEVTGDSGVPLVAVHGAWGTLGNWDMVVPALAERCRVVAYDRRGHSNSERPPGQGSYRQDADDLAGLIENLGLAPAWLMGLSSGAFITLLLAATRPELVRGIILHEPPVWSLLDEGSPEAAAFEAMAPVMGEILERIASGDHAGAAEQFTNEFVLGPGGWARMPDDVRSSMVENAPTVPDEMSDPEIYTIDGGVFARYRGPVLITSGEHSPPIYLPLLKRLTELLPQTDHAVCPGASHLPHMTHPDDYARLVLAFTSARERAE